MNDDNVRLRDVIPILHIPFAIRNWWQNRKDPPRRGVRSLDDMRRDAEHRRRLDEWPDR